MENDRCRAGFLHPLNVVNLLGKRRSRHNQRSAQPYPQVSGCEIHLRLSKHQQRERDHYLRKTHFCAGHRLRWKFLHELVCADSIAEGAID